MLLTRLRRLGRGPSGSFAAAGEGGALLPLPLDADLAKASAEPVEQPHLRVLPVGAYHVEAECVFAPARLLSTEARAELGLGDGDMQDTGPDEDEALAERAPRR